MLLFMKAWRLDLVVGRERSEIHGGGCQGRGQKRPKSRHSFQKMGRVILHPFVPLGI